MAALPTNVVMSCNASNTLVYWIDSGSTNYGLTGQSVSITQSNTLSAYATNFDAGRGSALTTALYYTNAPAPPPAAYGGDTLRASKAIYFR